MTKDAGMVLTLLGLISAGCILVVHPDRRCSSNADCSGGARCDTVAGVCRGSASSTGSSGSSSGAGGSGGTGSTSGSSTGSTGSGSSGTGGALTYALLDGGQLPIQGQVVAHGRAFGQTLISVANAGLQVAVAYRDGGFGVVPVFPASGPADFRSVAMGDLDGDGNDDIAATEGQTLLTLLSMPDGGFIDGGVWPMIDPHELVIGDLDRDGHADVAVADKRDPGGGIYVLLGSDAGLTAPFLAQSLRGARTLAAGAFQDASLVALGDPYPDAGVPVLIVQDGGSPLIRVAAPGSSEVTARPLTFGSSGDAIVVSGGDGLTITVFPDPLGEPIFLHERSPLQAVLVDVNADTRRDLVTVDDADSAIEVWIGDGTGNFAAPQLLGNLAPAEQPGFISVFDLNGDGITDVLVGSQNGFPVRVFYGQLK